MKSKDFKGEILVKQLDADWIDDNQSYGQIVDLGVELTRGEHKLNIGDCIIFDKDTGIKIESGSNFLIKLKEDDYFEVADICIADVPLAYKDESTITRKCVMDGPLLGNSPRKDHPPSRKKPKIV